MQKIIRVWDKTEEILVVVLIGIASYLTFQEVILRYVFNTGWSGSYEITVMALIWCTFIGASLGVKENIHIGVDVLVEIALVHVPGVQTRRAFQCRCGLQRMRRASATRSVRSMLVDQAKHLVFERRGFRLPVLHLIAKRRRRDVPARATCICAFEASGSRRSGLGVEITTGRHDAHQHQAKPPLRHFPHDPR